jgi:hypothetical protein
VRLSYPRPPQEESVIHRPKGVGDDDGVYESFARTLQARTLRTFFCFGSETDHLFDHPRRCRFFTFTRSAHRPGRYGRSRRCPRRPSGRRAVGPSPLRCSLKLMPGLAFRNSPVSVARLRLNTRKRSPSRRAMNRKPSCLTSNAHHEPSGTAYASVGRDGSMKPVRRGRRDHRGPRIAPGGTQVDKSPYWDRPLQATHDPVD